MQGINTSNMSKVTKRSKLCHKTLETTSGSKKKKKATIRTKISYKILKGINILKIWKMTTRTTICHKTFERISASKISKVTKKN